MSRPPNPVVPRFSLGSAVTRILLHVVFLLVAVGCLAAYEHFKAGGRPDAALASLVGAGLFGFMPLRDLIGILFRIEGTALHLVHGLGGLALIALPLSGAVSGTYYRYTVWAVTDEGLLARAFAVTLRAGE